MDIFYFIATVIAWFVVILALIISAILIGLFENSLFKHLKQKKEMV